MSAAAAPTADELAAGRADIDHVAAQLARHFNPPERFAHALDFGCRHGRLLPAMSAHAQRLSGTDVSRARLKAARKLGATLSPAPHLSTDMPDGPFDWINSLQVFQQILPARGMDLLDGLLARCAPDCVLSLHVLVRLGPDAVHAPGALFAYDAAALLHRLARAGFPGTYIETLDHAGDQAVRVLAARGRYF